MDASETPQKAIALGELLVKELGPPRQTGMLSRWMAYYIGEQLTLAKTATGARKAKAEERCFNAILTLWAHRSELPNGFRPFDGFEPILRALARLDPDEPRPFYYKFGRDQQEQATKDKQQQAVDSWLGFVESTDRTARVLIEIGLNLASKNAKTESTKAVVGAAPSSATDHDITVIKRLLERQDSKLDSETAAGMARVKQLEDRVAMLAWFRRVSKKMETYLAKVLKQAKKSLPKKGAAKSAGQKKLSHE
jgi:hypothetical protein